MAVLADLSIFAFRTAFIGGRHAAANGTVPPLAKPSIASGKPEVPNSIISAAKRAGRAVEFSGRHPIQISSANFPRYLLRSTTVEPVGRHRAIEMPKLCVEFFDPLRLVEWQERHANDLLIVNWRNGSSP